MAESLRGGLSLGLSGFGFWSHDIGGFEQTANASVYKRWCAFGLLSSHSRLHGSGSYRVPWLFDEEAVDVLRFFTRLKCSLMPYLFQAARQAHQQGLPMLRAMLLEFPGDPACETLDRQYMLGDSLLVAPVFSSEGWVDYYLPAGVWTHLLTGERRQGPGWQRERHGFMSLPLFVRPNTILPLGNRSDTPEYDYGENVTLQIYALAEGTHAPLVVPGMEGEEDTIFQLEKDGELVTITCQGRPVNWQALLIGRSGASLVEAGTLDVTEMGTFVKARAGSGKIKIKF
jgi:alpha-D-xyloside xylohydrolase